MIKVQATKQQQSSSQPSRDNYLERPEKVSSFGPVAFLVATFGFVAYLKSFLTTPADAAVSTKDDNLRDHENSDAAPLEDEEAATTGALQEPSRAEDAPHKVLPFRTARGSGSVDSFMTKDQPPIEFPAFRPTALVKLDGQPISFATNDNQAAILPEDEPRSAGGGGGGGGGDSDERERDDDLPDERDENRAPRLNGPVRLHDVVGCATAYFIAISALLEGATDPDGDALRPVLLSTSSGTLTEVQGGWILDVTGIAPDEIELKYWITDSSAFVEQVAYLRIVDAPPVVETVFDDILLGTNCSEVVDGRDGNDNIDARSGNDIVYGGTGDDHIVAGDGNDTVYAGSGNDIVFAGAGNDIVFGGTGDDRLSGDAGHDILYGEQGNDVIDGGEGNDTLDGDTGDDRLAGGSGDDIVLGGDGADELAGNAGNDVLVDGRGADVVTGGDGDDTVVAAADAISDTYHGEDGDDALDYSVATISIVVDLENGTAKGLEIGHDLISGFERVITGAGDDHVLAGRSSLEITGGSGNDTFEFTGPGGDDQPESVRKITDFTIGDRLIVANYEVRYREGVNASEQITDLFEDLYLSTEQQRPIRFRFEDLDDNHRTFVDMLRGEDAEDYYSIELSGRHDLEFSVTVTPQQAST